SQGGQRQRFVRRVRVEPVGAVVDHGEADAIDGDALAQLDAFERQRAGGDAQAHVAAAWLPRGQAADAFDDAGEHQHAPQRQPGPVGRAGLQWYWVMKRFPRGSQRKTPQGRARAPPWAGARAVFFHPDCDRRLRTWTGSADPPGTRRRSRARRACCAAAYRRWGVAPRPEDVVCAGRAGAGDSTARPGGPRGMVWGTGGTVDVRGSPRARG